MIGHVFCYNQHYRLQKGFKFILASSRMTKLRFYCRVSANYLYRGFYETG